MFNELIKAMEKAIQELKQWPDKAVQIFHHNDADWLCSGVILTRAFERQGFRCATITKTQNLDHKNDR
jgi:single-stranded DNA-specific DHH superfamily exonuclease